MKTYVGIVADLGLAEKIPTKLDMESKLSIVGSPYYMAPEVLCNRPYNNMVRIIVKYGQDFTTNHPFLYFYSIFIKCHFKSVDDVCI